MITRFATFTSRMAVALSMMLAIAACGGGGGSSGGGGFLGGAGSGGSDDDTYFIQLSLNDADGNPSSIVTANQPGTLQVLVTEKSKKRSRRT